LTARALTEGVGAKIIHLSQNRVTFNVAELGKAQLSLSALKVYKPQQIIKCKYEIKLTFAKA